MTWLALCSSAWAQNTQRPDDALVDDPEYRQLVAKGIQEFNYGHWQEARAYFLRAHELHPNARTFRTLGLISYELRAYVQALDYLQRALENQVRPLTDAMRAEVQTRARREDVHHLGADLSAASGGRAPDRR